MWINEERRITDKLLLDVFLEIDIHTKKGFSPPLCWCCARIHNLTKEKRIVAPPSC
jgi:hypothetical protein